MANDYNMALTLGAGLSFLAAAMHVGVIIGGPSWYHLFGAGKRFVRAAEAGSWYPTVVTSAIALMLWVWGMYALSGAEVIKTLPWLRPALCAITLVYLLRGMAGPFVLLGKGHSMRFILISSAVCLIYGVVHLIGLVQVWSALG